MILTAYFDESGVHEGSELSLMAGFVGDARQWRKFEKRTSKLFKRFRVDVFHTIDVKRTDKDFQDWKVDKKIEFLDEFSHIINETLERGLAATLKNGDYDYYRNLYWPKRARRDSSYALLCRACISAVLNSALEIPRWSASSSEPRLNIVLESGHRNAPDALRVYNFFRERVGLRGQRALAGLTFAKKEDCLPLGAADLFAYSLFNLETSGKPIGASKKPIKS